MKGLLREFLYIMFIVSTFMWVQNILSYWWNQSERSAFYFDEALTNTIIFVTGSLLYLVIRGLQTLLTSDE